jgi:hypothetical protein
MNLLSTSYIPKLNTREASSPGMLIETCKIKNKNRRSKVSLFLAKGPRKEQLRKMEKFQKINC